MGVPLSGKYDAVQLKADMKCLVDGLTAQLDHTLLLWSCQVTISHCRFEGKALFISDI